LSQNPLEKKAIEYIANALSPAPAQGLESLKLDDCALKPAALEVLGALELFLDFTIL
jgi:protein phosphatase 1 regulatory subunit 37